MDGQVSLYDFMNEVSFCYNCLFEDEGEEDEICVNSGVLLLVVGLVGSIQVMEVIKQLIGVGVILVGKLLMVDVFNMCFCEVKISKNLDCIVCFGKYQVVYMYWSWVGIDLICRVILGF